MSEELKQRFLCLLTQLGAKEALADSAWIQLSELYQGEGRYYHTLKHVDHMLRLLDKHVPETVKTVELELAIWYHDVIYDPQSKENEKNSALLCRETLAKLHGLQDSQVELVLQLIMSTQGHTLILEGSDKALNEYMLDIDLSILGASHEAYMRYSEEIRKEYIHMPLADYKAGRSQVLETFLQRDRLYFSPIFHELFEEKARVNLQAEISLLRE